MPWLLSCVGGQSRWRLAEISLRRSQKENYRAYYEAWLSGGAAVAGKEWKSGWNWRPENTGQGKEDQEMIDLQSERV